MQLIGRDPALASILKEYAAGQEGMRFEVAEKNDATLDADILFFSAEDVGTLTHCCKWALAFKQQGNTARIPLLILAKTLPEPEEEAAELGFHAVFKKPLRLAAVLDTAFSAWRLGRLKQPRALSPQVVFNPFTRALEDKAKGLSVSLTEKEAGFLLATLLAGDKGLPREKALTEIWGYHRDADSHAVETTVYRLRQKLQQCFGNQEALVSEGGAYRLAIQQ